MPPGPVAVLGGTFDPPHIGHLVLAECVRSQFACERVLFIPAGEPYRKTGIETPENVRAPLATRRMVSPAALRLEMCRLATEGDPAFAVDDREVRRPGASYTVETLESLHAGGATEIILVLGSDVLADLPNWRSPDRIDELARVVVAPKGFDEAPDHPFPVVDMPRIGLSSTLIRARAAAGKSIRYLVPAPVEAFIRQQGLYTG